MSTKKPSLLTKLLIVDFIIRFIQSLLIQTSYWPDEYWQSLEISHLTVFNYGFKYGVRLLAYYTIRTWEWEQDRIRSYIAILPYILLYQLLKILV